MKCNRCFQRVSIFNLVLAALVSLALSVAADARPGDLDKNFGANRNGIARTVFPVAGQPNQYYSAFAAKAVLQPDGKILVSGGVVYADSDIAFGRQHALLVRYKPDGSLDSSFGSGGVVITAFPISPATSNDDSSYFTALALQPDGKILAAGYSVTNTFVGGSLVCFFDVVMARYNTDGSLDATFGSGGRVFTSTGDPLQACGGNTMIYDLALGSDGSIYAVGGGSYSPSGRNSIVIKYASNGVMTALQKIDFYSANEVVSEAFNSVNLQSDGKLVLGLFGDSGYIDDFVLMRLNPTLTIDASFGANGVAQTDFGTGVEKVAGITIDPDGKITACGNSASGNNTGNFYAARFNQSGSLDSTFGTGGKVIVLHPDPPITADKEAAQIVRQPDGKYICALGARYGNWGAIRLLPNGSLDPTFGYGGIAHYGSSNSPYPTIDGYGGLILLQPNGKIILAGTESRQSAGDYRGIGIKITRLTNYYRNDIADADFDGDDKVDLSVFRPTGGQWWYQQSSDNNVRAFQFGTSTDKPVPADYDGDGKTDIAIWRPSTGEWFVLRSSNLTFFAAPFGISTDIPAPGDFDGDGKADFAVFRPSTGMWWVQRTTAGTLITQFGLNGDIPTVGDYDGDGKVDIAIFRPSDGSWWVQRSTSGFLITVFGVGTDKPVQADYTGDGKTDIAFWRPSNGYWYVLRSEDLSFYAAPFGSQGDVAAPGDYDGDGKTDFAVFRPNVATWFIQRTTQGTYIQQFGLTGDVPAPSAYIP